MQPVLKSIGIILLGQCYGEKDEDYNDGGSSCLLKQTQLHITVKAGTEIPGGGGGGTSPDSTALSLQWTALSAPFYLCITAGGKVTRQHP